MNHRCIHYIVFEVEVLSLYVKYCPTK